MSRDYSSRRNNTSNKSGRKSTRRKPAARSTAKKRNAPSGPPGWLWMLCGLCIGLTVAAGFYVFARPAGSSAREQISIATPNNGGNERPADNDKAAANGGAPPPEEKEEEPRFSFYKMLPNYEVVIPEEEYPDKRSGHDGGHHTTASSHTPPAHTASAPDKSTPQPTTPKVEEPGNYIIQAGSFSTHGDADRRKAELAMLGVSARIVDVDLASGKTVYRVQSDTIQSSDKLNQLLKRLRENRIDTLVMRAKH